MSFFLQGNPSYLHQCIIVLSLTPYILPILTNDVVLIKFFNSSLDGLSTILLHFATQVLHNPVLVFS